MLCLFLPESPSRSFPSLRLMQEAGCPHIRELTRSDSENPAGKSIECGIDLFAICDTPCQRILTEALAVCNKPATPWLWIAGSARFDDRARGGTKPVFFNAELESLAPNLLGFEGANGVTSKYRLDTVAVGPARGSAGTLGENSGAVRLIRTPSRPEQKAPILVKPVITPKRHGLRVVSEAYIEVNLAGLQPQSVVNLAGSEPPSPKPIVSDPGGAIQIANETKVPSIGIVTALPLEFIALASILDSSEWLFVPGRGPDKRYMYGEVPGANGGLHKVVLCLLTEMGNNSAAIRASQLLQHFPSVQDILMVGIAGGIPNPENPAEHVRLGDIVVSDRNGVVQYDFDKESIDTVESRNAPRPPSAVLMESAALLGAMELTGFRPWEGWIRQLCSMLRVEYPGEEHDVLFSTTDPHARITHPIDDDRRPGIPRVFRGAIASANKLLKNPYKRDQLGRKFKAKAVEMEGSGIADATWSGARGYMVIRGICDYCDGSKGDRWQRYAAVVASAYARALLESCVV